MGFEGEFASYKPLNRILSSERVERILKKFKIKKIDESKQGIKKHENNLINKKDLPSNFLPEFIIAIDGSYHPSPVESGLPNAEIGYITISAVLMLERKLRKQLKENFIDPKEFRKIEDASSIDTAIPGCNIIIDNEKTAKASMRKILFETLKEKEGFEDTESLLETYEYLFKIKRNKDEKSTKLPQSPIDDIEDEMIYDYGEYKCPVSQENLYSTDALRLHELMKPSGTNGDMYGQIMGMIEKLYLINILRSFEKKGWFYLLSKFVFVLDGPLACFSTWSWLNKSIIAELARINELQKKKTGKDLLIFGVEKTGIFVNHFEQLDTESDGSKDKLPNQSAFLISDEYIKQNIIFSDSEKPYGQDTYFGRKLFYKTKMGYKIVAVVAFFDEKHRDLKTAEIEQYPRLADLMNVLDEFYSSRYPNSISPLVSAHAEAAIPLNLGKKLFENIAQEIKERPS